MTVSKGASSSKNLLKFLKGSTPKMPAWRMYGSLYNDEVLKPLVDRAHDTACQEHNATNKEHEQSVPGNGKKKKIPMRVVSWTAVAQALYEKETEEVKRKVLDAVKEQSRLTKAGLALEQGMDREVAQLEAYAVQLLRNLRTSILTSPRSIHALPQTLQMLLDWVESETGYPIVMLWGGPQVNENGAIGTWQYVMVWIRKWCSVDFQLCTMVSMESRKTTTGSKFSAWHKDWEQDVIKPFGQFINECFCKYWPWNIYTV